MADTTVAELIRSLSAADPAAVVMLGHAPGPVAHVTETVNGFVILDKCTGGTCCAATRAAEAVASGA